MKSIKPGRYPSMQGAVMGVVVAVFGIFWTIMAVSMGAPIIFPLFGLVFIALAVGQAIHHYKNATGKNRTSLYDITEEGEEPDRLERYIKKEESWESFSSTDSREIKFCPYCGKSVDDEYEFCPKCGRKLP